MMRTWTLLACIAVFMTGCPRAVKYEAPRLPVPVAIPAADRTPAAPAAADLKWQEFVGDSKLRSIIDLALANNRDLRIASLNIEKF
jgi:multidrug efflux system outer membrane protein